MSELDCDDALSASDEYSKDENLKMMVRWLRSHTEQDVERLQNGLSEIIESLFGLEKDAPWDEVQLQLLRFCDVWGNAFGWPTVGQMLDFARIFQEMANDDDEVEPELAALFNEDACNKLSQIFYLAWADNGLRVLDDIFINAYFEFRRYQLPTPVLNLAQLICSLACELGGRPHLYKGEKPPACPEELSNVVNAVFDALEWVILDGESGLYLDIDSLLSIDQRSMDFARNLAVSFATDSMTEWERSRGRVEFVELAGEWYNIHIKYFEFACSDEHTGKPSSSQGAHGFNEWLAELYERVIEDPPRPYWITEEEAIAHEKKMRALVQEMIARQETAEDVDSEADE